MRVTVDFPEKVHQRLKIRAIREGCSMKSLILRGIKEVLTETRRNAKRRRISSSNDSR
jgi:plasmid stability protein